MGILPVALFASGHTYFVQRLHEQMDLDVYAVHATFQYSGTPGKRHRMRERLLWLAVRMLRGSAQDTHCIRHSRGKKGYITLPFICSFLVCLVCERVLDVHPACVEAKAFLCACAGPAGVL